MEIHEYFVVMQKLGIFIITRTKTVALVLGCIWK